VPKVGRDHTRCIPGTDDHQVRKPGSCTNALKLPIAQTDAIVLDMIEGEVLGGTVIDDLLTLVERRDPDEVPRLKAECVRLRGEVGLRTGYPPRRWPRRFRLASWSWPR